MNKGTPLATCTLLCSAVHSSNNMFFSFIWSPIRIVIVPALSPANLPAASCRYESIVLFVYLEFESNKSILYPPCTCTCVASAKLLPSTSPKAAKESKALACPFTLEFLSYDNK